MLYFILFLTVLLSAGLILDAKRTGILLRYIYYLRVPIIFGPLTLFALGYFGFISGNALQNALVTERPIQVGILSFQAAFLALLFIYYREQIWVYAQKRFDAPKSPFPLPDRKEKNVKAALSEIASVIMIIPLILVVLQSNEVEGWSMQSLTLIALLGVVAAHVSVFWLREEAADDLHRLLCHLAAKLPVSFRRAIDPGFFEDVESARIYEGHAKSIFLGLITFSVYFLSYFLLNPSFRNNTENSVLLTIFNYWDMAVTPGVYLMGMAMFLMTLFSGITFFVDRFRIPLITLLLAVTYLKAGLTGEDHYFQLVLAKPTELSATNFAGRLEVPEEQSKTTITPELSEKTKPGTPQGRLPYTEPPTLTQALTRRLDLVSPNDTRREAVVVCASGGGIQAAAWSTQVLAGLDEITDGSFAKSVHLISSTSGGSVGTLYYIDGYNRLDGGNDLPGSEMKPHPEYYENLYQMRRAAAKSSLEEMLWGYCLIDIPRAFFPTPWAGRFADRGWALESSWRKELSDLRRWRSEVSSLPYFPDKNYTINAMCWATMQGSIPGVVLNTTGVEDGGHVTIGTITFPQQDGKDSSLTGQSFQEKFRPLGGEGESLSSEEANTFIPDINGISAVRLSAAFPYITPISKPYVVRALDADGEELPRKDFAPRPLHLTDGGFFDNLGIIAGVEWIRTVGDDPSLANRLDRITIIQLLDREEDTEISNIRSRGEAWELALIGPLKTIANVRGSTQSSRSNLEISLLRRAYPNIEIDYILLSPIAFYRDENGEEIDHDPPLSWKLSEKDLEKIQQSWLFHLWENQELKDLIKRLKAIED